MHELPNTVGSEVASWKPNPCQGTSFFKSSTTTNSCNFLPNMAKCFKILFMLTFCDNSDSDVTNVRIISNVSTIVSTF